MQESPVFFQSAKDLRTQTAAFALKRFGFHSFKVPRSFFFLLLENALCALQSARKSITIFLRLMNTYSSIHFYKCIFYLLADILDPFPDSFQNSPCAFCSSFSVLSFVCSSRGFRLRKSFTAFSSSRSFPGDAGAVFWFFRISLPAGGQLFRILLPSSLRILPGRLPRLRPDPGICLIAPFRPGRPNFHPTVPDPGWPFHSPDENPGNLTLPSM